MAWQILAMWILAMVTIAWFVRRERGLIANATMAQAAFLHAHRLDRPRQDDAPARPLSDAPVPVRQAARGPEQLSSAERQFLKALSQTP